MTIESTPIINVLLVEDNPDHAELIRRSLRNVKTANRIFHVTDGEDAQDFLLHKNGYEDTDDFPTPHLIILDLRLPRMSGLEFLGFVKNRELLREIPVVVLSTSKSEDDIREAYQNYANSYLVKPTGFESFSGLITDMGYYWFKRNKLHLE
ncbi:MAG: response regulator [Bacteroidia bacterium]|nr:response regulator [Bacteroidia bacterium]